MALFIVAAFLVFTLLVGIYFSFSKKITTFREYAMGHKRFATATLVATVLATNFGGGGLIRTVEQVHRTGLYWITLFILATFGLYIVGWLALRMGPFMQHLSMAETIGSVYGKYARFIAALSGTLTLIVYLTGQINVMSLAIRMCVDSANSHFITIAATLIVILYSMFGGIRAITFTDVLQFITFAVIIPLLAYYVMLSTTDKSGVISFLQSQEKFQFRKLFYFDTQLFALIALCLSDIVSNIDPQNIQRVYMSSGPIQGRRVFLYATLFGLVIKIIIILSGLFVFVGAPELPVVAVWDYIMTHIPPIFKGLLSISLLAMTMSTADSILNASVVMVSHDMLESIRGVKETPYANQLRLARRTTLIVGLAGMVLACRHKDLLQLMYWTLDLSIPITTAPFILAIFGFRGSSRTALIGMTTGVLFILAWNKWVEPSTGIDGSFLAMLANGLAMMAAHYLLKQPESAGWVKPDNEFKQMQQERARKKRERREAIKNSWANRKLTLAKLIPNHTLMVYVGFYFTITSLLAYSIARVTHHRFWLIFQLFGAACCLGYPFIYDISKKIRAIPHWFVGLCWLIVLAVYLPLNLLRDWWHLVDPIFTASLSLTHCGVILWVLPFHLAIWVVGALLLASIYPIATGLPFPILCSLLPLFLATLLILIIIIWFKIKQNGYITQILYLKNQEQIRRSRQLKASLYDSAMVPATAVSKTKGYGAILTQVVGKIEESISFLDGNMPLYKQDFQSIINKLYDWVAYFNKREKAKKHALLQPAKITLDKLIHKVEVALSQEVTDPPRLLVEKMNNPNLSGYIICDIHQVVYLLVQAVLRVGKPEGSVAPLIKIQLHPTALQFKQTDAIEHSDIAYMLFQATALVISQATTAVLPKVKARYDEDALGGKKKRHHP